MLYVCENCKKVFDKKSNYLFHINRKKPCSLETKQRLENKLFECDTCGEKFTAYNNMQKHKKMYCKGVPIKEITNENNNSNKEQTLELVKNPDTGDIINLNDIVNNPKIISELFNIISKDDECKNIIKNSNEITNNTTNIKNLNNTNNIKNSNNTTNNNLNANVQNNTTNNNNIFIMAAFGKEGRIQVPKALLHSLYRNMENAIPRLVEYIHYNDNFPQFQNIEGKGISNSYVSIFDGSNWILQRKDEVVEKLIKDKKEILDDFFDGMVENNHSKLNSKIIKNYNEQSDKLDSVLNKDFYDIQPEKDAKALYKSIQTNVGLIMENQKIKKKAKKNVKKLD
jgi:DNA-directed RNA polymerase subunit RPC12/RpoP